MNRILEAYEGDTEFSRSRLIDEDASMQIELKTMKVNGLYHVSLNASIKKLLTLFALSTCKEARIHLLRI